MPDLLLTGIDLSGYISPVCLGIFLIMFFAWLWLVTWVHTDAGFVGTNRGLWTGVIFATGAAGLIIWTLLPMFIIGVLLYIILLGASLVSYIMHRNALVMEFDRVLTPEHIKSLFVKDEAKLEALRNFVFITANKNEVPLPEPRTPEFMGFKSAYELMNDAIWRRAEMVYVSPRTEDYEVVYNIDGASLKQPSIPKQQMEHCIHFLKQVTNLSTDEKRKPQNGPFKTRHVNNITDWELHSAGSTAGEQIQIKLKTKKEISKIEDIGLSGEQIEQLKQLQKSKQGLFIVSGPPKTGVSTTFYAVIRNHDPFIYNINTLERQPTAELLNVTQNVCSLGDTGTNSYGKKLESVVRMGPDIVGVADCEDSETSKVSCRSSKDGKIIYVTLKSDNVVQAITKWIKLVGDKELAIDTLLGVSNQRLLRNLCNECKQAYEPNKDTLRKFNIPTDKSRVFYRAGKVQYDKHGKPATCDHCQGIGFYGRTCVFEMVVMDNALRDLLKKAKSSTEISTYIRGAKMLYLQEQALRRVLGGITSINEMIRVFSGSKKITEEQ